MSETRIETARNLLRDCLGVQAGESLVVVADDSRRDLADSLYEAGRRLGAETVLAVMGERSRSGEEPPAAVADAMAAAAAVVCVTRHSLTHTQARKRAAAAGARVATMPGITEDMFSQGAITADYGRVRELTERVTARLSDVSEVRVEKNGRSLSFSVAGRDGVPSTGLYLNPGESGNLPSGEAYIAPVEGRGGGEILVDGSIAGIGALEAPVLLRIEDGRLVAAEGLEGARLLEILGGGEGRTLAEFGIGTNDKARITGVVLEDEKVYGTIHIAFGSNHTFGGTVDAGVHIDCVVKEPDVYFDGKPVIRAGEWID
ncbi:aminopeptidase [Saccharibacillus sp. O23]|uniref:aminopeptidase n=1 Tax=Saccharibacillus sp. O23 TaxID=2009338 RepID=UPI000B4E3D16|nr:aminopeptidase [Saccharibacillus sp. O23]OWR31513.1 aminopeptidase [Saccharibacillus sp. O23]